MCRPTHFRVEYSINPWMNPNDRVDHEKAMKQWNTLKQSIENAGALVEVMEPHVIFVVLYKNIGTMLPEGVNLWEAVPR